MRRALLILSVLGLWACVLTPKDFESDTGPSPNFGASRDALEQQSAYAACGKGGLTKVEACLQSLDLARRKRTHR